MSEYYGSPQASSDFIAHYGVKGMKWGVRKSIMKGNERRLARHYKKAAKKLAKLDWKADPKAQEKHANIQNKVAKIGLSVGLAGLGTTAGAHGVLNALLKKQRSAYDEFYHPGWEQEAIARHKMFESGDWERYNSEHAKRVIQAKNLEDASNNLVKYGNRAYKVSDVASAIGGIGLGMGIAAKVSAANAKWRTTPKGHAKMKANRDAWKKEMESAFKGTQYDASGSVKKKKKKVNV